MRKHDWPEILAAKILEWKDIPFKWGETDCAMFVIDIVNSMTDLQIVNRSVGLYSTEEGADAAIEKLGSSLSALVSERFGDPIPVSFAQRGDVVMQKNNLGICIGINSAFRTPRGLVTFKTVDCEAAWRVE